MYDGTEDDLGISRSTLLNICIDLVVSHKILKGKKKGLRTLAGVPGEVMGAKGVGKAVETGVARPLGPAAAAKPGLGAAKLAGKAAWWFHQAKWLPGDFALWQ